MEVAQKLPVITSMLTACHDSRFINHALASFP